MARVGIATRAELKHDMDYLNTMQQLKEQPQNKKLKKEIKLTLKHEKRYEESKQAEQEEAKRGNAELDGNGMINKVSAKPQLYHAINFLANYFVRFLPTAVCVICGNRLVTDLKKGNKDFHEMVPERAFCGHWFHSKCIEDMINEPPFKHQCPYEGCEQTLASNNFSSDP